MTYAPQLPAAPAPGQRLLTPRLRGAGNTRLNLHVSEADYGQIRRGKHWGPVHVTDLRTGNQFRVFSAACGSPGCHCDAIATPLREKP